MDQRETELYRGRVAWHMQMIDVRIGHDGLGFDYPMSGDARPDVRERREETR